LARKRLVKFYKGSQRNYEIPIIMSQKLSETELKAQLSEMRVMITKEFEAEVIDISNTSIRPYAYPIQTPNNKKGYFACMYIKANPEKIHEIRKKLSSENNVLRVFAILANPKKQSYGIFSPKYEEEYSSHKNKNKLFSYDDPNTLLKFIGERGKIEGQKSIVGKKIVYNLAKKQRIISKTIKTARLLSILPYQED